MGTRKRLLHSQYQIFCGCIVEHMVQEEAGGDGILGD